MAIHRRNLPLASQLIQELASGISSGSLIDENGRLPSEADLCHQFNVSRSTVREALAHLEQAGIVSRHHGIGTFVRQTFRQNPDTIWGWLDEAPAFVDLIFQSGHEASCNLLSVKLGQAGRFAGLIGIDVDTPVIHIEKLFYADGEPVIYSSTVLPFDLIASDQQASSLSREVYQKSIYEIFQDHSQQSIDHQTSEIRAVAASERLAELLACEQGSPLIKVEEIGNDLGQTPLFHALHYFRGDRISFHQIRLPTFFIEPD